MSYFKHSLFVFFLTLSSLCALNNVKAQTPVRVLAYIFPPFLNEDEKTGLIPDIVEALNKYQTEYTFSLIRTSPKRRYKDLHLGRADMMLFEMPEWGWDEGSNEYSFGQVLFTGGELYITAKGKAFPENYFQNLKSKRIAGYFGYHYGFADYHADKNWLDRNFDITLLHSHRSIIELVINEKVDIGVVTGSYLYKFFNENPMARNKISISSNYDQLYMLRSLVRNNSPIDIRKLEELLSLVRKEPSFKQIIQDYGIASQVTF